MFWTCFALVGIQKGSAVESLTYRQKNTDLQAPDTTAVVQK